MKHFKIKILSIVLLSFTSIVAFSQNNWTINGNGNTSAGTNFLGTTNNQALNFRTADVQRMRLTETGFLGIGTTTPLSMLHINGSQGINVLTGEVFRTSCSGADSYWRMFAGAQRGAIYGLANDNHFRMQSMTRDARLVFHSSFSTLAPIGFLKITFIT